MHLEALHHVTMITADARANVAFYAELLGLRLVKKTVNFDAPEAYHLYFGDEHGTPGSILTWFEFAGVPRGRPGAGMIHTLQLGVDGEAALDFWKQRLDDAGHPCGESGGTLRFADHEGLDLELHGDTHGNPPLTAAHPDIPPQFAITGVQGARAFARRPGDAHELLTRVLGFDHKRTQSTSSTGTGSHEYVLGHGDRHVHWAYDQRDEPGREGAGTVHHIAWHSRDEDHVAWRDRVREAGLHATDVIDRDYFKSVYFRTPQGILFEIATTSPGFAVDEDPAHLGEQLRLPRRHEHLRPQLERRLAPIAHPRA